MRKEVKNTNNYFLNNKFRSPFLFPNTSKYDKREKYKSLSQRVLFGTDYLIKKGRITEIEANKLHEMFTSNDIEMQRLALSLSEGYWSKERKLLSPQPQKLLK